MKKILISGGNGAFGTELQKQGHENFNFAAPSRSRMDITKYSDIYRITSFHRPDYFIHAAAMTRPMAGHEKNPINSMQTNIVGTANVVEACISLDIKLIYISTDYVYPSTKTGMHSENSALLPFTNYGWSKLGGECAVQMYDNSLVLRMAMCEKPFPHPKTYDNVYKSSIFNDEAAKVTLRLLDEIGIINIGGKAQSIHNFVSSHQTTEAAQHDGHQNTTMNIDRMNNALSRRR